MNNPTQYPVTTNNLVKQYKYGIYFKIFIKYHKYDTTFHIFDDINIQSMNCGGNIYYY